MSLNSVTLLLYLQGDNVQIAQKGEANSTAQRSELKNESHCTDGGRSRRKTIGNAERTRKGVALKNNR